MYRKTQGFAYKVFGSCTGIGVASFQDQDIVLVHDHGDGLDEDGLSNSRFCLSLLSTRFFAPVPVDWPWNRHGVPVWWDQ